MYKRTLVLLTFTLLATGLLEKSIHAFGVLDASFSSYTLQDAGTMMNAIAKQADGKIIIGGQFSYINGVRRTSIARLNEDGSLDSTFSAEANGEVKLLAVQQNGKIIVGGTFASVNGAPYKDIARLNSNGTLDATFNPGTGLGGFLFALAVQSDGKIIIGGFFSDFNGIPRRSIARLNIDGSLDMTFNTVVGTSTSTTSIYSLLVQVDGKILVGGFFSSVNETVRNCIARLNPDGNLDLTFNAETNPAIGVMSLQADGKIIIAGNFDTVNTVTQRRIARLNPNGSLDTAFTPIIGNGSDNNGVYVIEIQADGRLLIGGFIASINGIPRNNLALLNSDGNLNTSFNPSAQINFQVVGLSMQSDGKVFASGTLVNSNGTRYNRLTRLNADGSVDSAFALAVGNFSFVTKLAVQTDGKIAVSGGFSIVNGQHRTQLARLNADGSLDQSFNPGTGFINFSNPGNVFALAPYPNGAIMVGGEFSLANGVARRNIARLLADGTADPSFNPGTGVDARVLSIAVQPDGKIVIAGHFDFVNGTERQGIARLNADGSLDASFNALTGSIFGIYEVKLQSDGKIILIGGLLTFNNITRNGVARLNADGSLDSSFDPGAGANGSPGSIAIQSDGKYLIGGYFESFNGSLRRNIVRLNANGSVDTNFNTGTGPNSGVHAVAVQPNGKVVIAGYFVNVNGTARNRVARLDANGSLDEDFNISVGPDNQVDAMVLQPAGRIIIGGQFRTVNGQSHLGIARLSTASAFADFDSDSRTDVAVFRPSNGYWYVTESTNGVVRATAFGASGDRIAPGDYDGDGKTDTTVFRPSNGYWYTLDSSTGAFRAIQFGQADDIPTAADFDADGKTDIAVFRPSSGTFYLLYSSSGAFHFQQWGTNGDEPAVGDYDGDGKADFAIFRPSSGIFYILRSSDGAVVGQQFGQSGDKPIAADFDGDGKTDIAVFRQSTGDWYYLQSSDNSVKGIAWGSSGDVPAAGDYDGDGIWDVAVFRPSTGTFYILQSTNNSLRAEQFGANGDVPIPSAYTP